VDYLSIVRSVLAVGLPQMVAMIGTCYGSSYAPAGRAGLTWINIGRAAQVMLIYTVAEAA
jgi:hypothetical protein